MASRIKDHYYRPAIVFAKTETGELKGSGRSVPGVHLRDVLDEIAKKQPDLLVKFGGHAMAAGLSINEDNLARFSLAFDRVIARFAETESLDPVIYSDGNLREQEITLHNAEELREAGPWGQGFPEPSFDGVFYIVQQRIVGEKHLKLVVSPEEVSTKMLDAIAFNVDTNAWPNSEVNRVRIVYKLAVNAFRGQRSVQLLVDYIEPADSIG